MNRPPLEVADLVRAAGRAFLERGRRWITWQHLKVLRAIARRRTAALGGHLDECTDCGVPSGHLLQQLPYGENLLESQQVAEWRIWAI
jgi:hypothetical protein